MKQHGSRAALCAGLCVLLLGGCAQPVEYETVRPDRGPVEYRVEDTGTAAYGDNYTVVPTVSGRVTQCTIQEGDAVEEGQVLYVIDSGDLEDQITQARLSLRSAETAVEQSAAACEDLVVHSCATGTVMEVNVHVGDFVSAGTPIAQVVDSAHLTLTVPFIPADAAALVPGSLATITFPALAESVTGSVVRVYDSPTVFAGGREGVYVEFSLDNPGALASGGTAMAAVGALTCMEAGQLSNATEQAIYATQSGQVLTLPIQAGTAVVEGQEVMTIKNDSLTNAAQNAVLSRDSAAVSLSQLESKRPDYTVRSPAAGIVLTRSVKEGDLAAAGSPMAVLAQPEELCVQVDIDELYIDLCRIGEAHRRHRHQRRWSHGIPRRADPGKPGGPSGGDERIGIPAGGDAGKLPSPPQPRDHRGDGTGPPGGRAGRGGHQNRTHRRRVYRDFRGIDRRGRGDFTLRQVFRETSIRITISR